jgi:hypothetical protein
MAVSLVSPCGSTSESPGGLVVRMAVSLVSSRWSTFDGPASPEDSMLTGLAPCGDSGLSGMGSTASVCEVSRAAILERAR